MRFKALVLGIVVVMIAACLTPWVEALSGGIIHLAAIQVEALPPDRGTVVFIAQTEGNPLSEVGIKIDGVTKGFTDGEGKLKVEWLIAGEHSWEAIYGGEKISQGEFEIAEVVDAEIADRWVRVNGKDHREGFKVNVFKDTYIPFVTIKNTGTTMIDHFAVKWPYSREGSSLKVNLVSPPIPSWLWEPFVGEELFSTETAVGVIIKHGKVEMHSCYTGRPMDAPIIGDVPEEGLKPGETITLGVGFEEPYYYIQWMKDSIEGKGIELGTEISMEVVDEEKGIVHMIIKEYKFGPFTLHDIKVELRFKGPNKGETVSADLYIDDKLYDSHSWIDYEWVLD